MSDRQQFADLLQGHEAQSIQVTVVPKVRAEVNFKVKELEVKKRKKSSQKRKAKQGAEKLEEIL